MVALECQRHGGTQLADPLFVGLSLVEQDMLKDLHAYRGEWRRPMDLGGSDGSKHSRVLARLVNKGLVVRKSRNPLGDRPRWLYRISPTGIRRVELMERRLRREY